MTVMHSARSSLYFRQELFPVRQRSVHARSSKSWKAKREVSTEVHSDIWISPAIWIPVLRSGWQSRKTEESMYRRVAEL